MNPESNDFETLRKLMSLKRHEQPPPGYLDHLSDSIIARIEIGDGRLSLWDRISMRPGLAYAVGLTVCGALGAGSFWMARHEAADTSGTVAVTFKNTPAPLVASQLKPAGPTLHVANWLGNTNPTAETQPQISLFNPPHYAVPVSYTTAGN